MKSQGSFCDSNKQYFESLSGQEDFMRWFFVSAVAVAICFWLLGPQITFAFLAVGFVIWLFWPERKEVHSPREAATKELEAKN